MIGIDKSKEILTYQQDGYSHSAISRMLGVSRYAIRYVVNNPNCIFSRGGKDLFPPKEVLEKHINKCVSLAEVLKIIGLEYSGNNYRVLKNLIKEYNININHMLGQGHKKTINDLIKFNTIPIENILVEKSLYTGSRLSKRLRKDKLINYQCSECGLNEVWNKKQITLHLDHINGIKNDNRLTNLRFLCPNCHSQTSTYCGRNIKNKLSFDRIKFRQTCNSKKENFCPKCKCAMKSKRSKQCNSCKYKSQMKVIYPDIEELVKLIKELGYMELARRFGVCDNAIRKHIKKMGHKLT